MYILYIFIYRRYRFFDLYFGPGFRIQGSSFGSAGVRVNQTYRLAISQSYTKTSVRRASPLRCFCRSQQISFYFLLFISAFFLLFSFLNSSRSRSFELTFSLIGPDKELAPPFDRCVFVQEYFLYFHLMFIWGGKDVGFGSLGKYEMRKGGAIK